MPRKPKKPCRWPGCPNLTDKAYCEEHAAQAWRQYERYERSPDVRRKYKGEWTKIRSRYVMEHPLCERCLEKGRLTPVEEVHHILSVSQGGTHDTENLMSLCQSCHTKLHHELGDRRIRS